MVSKYGEVKTKTKNVNPVHMTRFFIAPVRIRVRMVQLKFMIMKMLFIAQIVMNKIHPKCKMQLK